MEEIEGKGGESGGQKEGAIQCGNSSRTVWNFELRGRGVSVISYNRINFLAKCSQCSLWHLHLETW